MADCSKLPSLATKHANYHYHHAGYYYTLSLLFQSNFTLRPILPKQTILADSDDVFLVAPCVKALTKLTNNANIITTSSSKTLKEMKQISRLVEGKTY